MIQYTTTVNASLQSVWQHLINKIDHPENFVPGISDVIIIERNEEFVIRKMTVALGEIATTLTEKITFKPYKIRFLLTEHPKFEGYVDNDIKPISENETEMTFTINWVDKITNEHFDKVEMVKDSVLKSKDFIENN